MGMHDFESLLASSARAHGHLCPGQVKKFLVFVEIDRCVADAIAHVTGAKLGRRSLKFMDYCIMAASFVNLETGESYRIVSTEESRDLTRAYAPAILGKAAQQLEAYKRMAGGVHFRQRRSESISGIRTFPVQHGAGLHAPGAGRSFEISAK